MKKFQIKKGASSNKSISSVAKEEHISLFERERRSLFDETLDWVLVPLLVIWLMGVVLTFLVAENIANRTFDRNLKQDLQALVQIVLTQANNLSQAKRLFLHTAQTLWPANGSDQVYYQIKQLRFGGMQLIGGGDVLPMPPDDGQNALGKVFLRNALVLSQDLRIVSTWVTLSNAPSEPILVQVGETLNKRKLLATGIVKGVSIPQFLLLPLALLLIWIALNRSVRPLADLEKTIRRRKPDDLSALKDDVVPEEIVPLVASINDLLGRLTQSVAVQKRFLADAAHQLKTPLAGLRMQADLAQRESNKPEDLKKSLSNIALASMRATRTVNQLLSLAQAEGGQAVQKYRAIDLSKLAQEVLQDTIELALVKSINLRFEVQDKGLCRIAGNAIMLKEMLRNLLENAINYTPADGDVVLRIFSEPLGATVLVQVEDNGPGISPAEREAIFHPFYRSLNNQVEGSGLGLAIVKEVVQQHHAHLEVTVPFSQDPQRPGVCFSLRFATI